MSLKLEDVTYTYSPGTAYEMHALEHINLEIPKLPVCWDYRTIREAENRRLCSI